MRLFEDAQLYKGIFWIVNLNDITKNRDYCFQISSDVNGQPVYDGLNLNSKNGLTYNHKLVWNQLGSKLTHNKPYNYYPRGRVEIRNGEAKIFLNGNIATDEVVKFIVDEFHLYEYNGIIKVITIVDNSSHYLCYLDSGYNAKRG